MNDLALLLGLGEQALTLALFTFLRVGTAMLLLPGFGESSIPVRLRLFAAFAFTALISPALPPEVGTFAKTTFTSPSVFLTELTLGLMLGLSLRLTIMVLQMAGTVIAQTISLSQVFAATGHEPMTVISELLVLGALALAVTLDLHVEIARTLLQNYLDMPPGRLPAAGQALDWITQRAMAAFRFALALSMPFVAVSLIYNFALGIINKAMPQLMVVMVGAPALTLGGLALLALALPLILSHWISHLSEILLTPF